MGNVGRTSPNGTSVNWDQGTSSNHDYAKSLEDAVASTRPVMYDYAKSQNEAVLATRAPVIQAPPEEAAPEPRARRSTLQRVCRLVARICG